MRTGSFLCVHLGNIPNQAGALAHQSRSVDGGVGDKLHHGAARFPCCEQCAYGVTKRPLTMSSN